MRRSMTKKDEYSGEYLNIDTMFTDKEAEWNEEDWNPLVLPSVVVELENKYEKKHIIPYYDKVNEQHIEQLLKTAEKKPI